MTSKTITVYKDDKAVIIDPSEKELWAKNGYKPKAGRPKKQAKKDEDSNSL